MHTLKKIIFDWTGDIHDCYVLQLKFLDQEFVPFCKNVPLQPLQESNEKLERQLQILENQDGHHSERDAGFTHLISFDEDGEDV